MFLNHVVRGRGYRAALFLFVMLLALSLPAFAQDSPQYTVGVELVAEGFTLPVDFTVDGSGRMFVVDLAGQIRIITADGQLLPEPFLDLSDKIVELDPGYDERGVLGLAFHPDYANNGRFFVYYSIPLRPDAPPEWNHTNVLSEFTVSADNPDVADPASERILWQHDHPQMNHNAGHITFGPDGYLYIPYGDGGGANDTDIGHTPEIGNGQDVSNMFGTIMRINVDANGGGFTYAIPEDNPFVGDDDIPDEIYAYGFRNPFDIAFDQEGRLFVSDAGQDLYEEISIVESGGNYGWNIKEATHCFDPDNPETPPETCEDTGTVLGDPLIDPIVEYSHDYGIVVIGARMYRGSAIADLQGHLIFGDYSSSAEGDPDGVLFWAEPSEDGGLWEWGELYIADAENNRIGAYVLSLAEDTNGELYVLTTENSGPTGNTGKVWRLVQEAGG